MATSVLSDAGEVSGRDGDTETETIDTIDSVANVGRDQVGLITCFRECPKRKLCIDHERQVT